MNRIKRTETAVYHCMTRAVAGEFLLDEEAKNVLRSLVWKVAGFCGVEVLAYCVMSNHFHVLVRVPQRVEGALSRAEVLRRYRILYEDSQLPEYPNGEGMRQILEGEDEALAQGWMDRLTVRMQDVSEFMRILKHRLTMWFNKKHGRFGTLWAERFKSVLVENCPAVLRTVAAYLDLNPVRAGLVADPGEYRWCSYAEAKAGKGEAQKGLGAVMGATEACWAAALRGYQVLLFGKGGGAGKKGGGRIPQERVRAVLRGEEGLEVSEMLRCRVRPFTEGVIVGSEDFVKGVADELRAAGETVEKARVTSSGRAGVRRRTKHWGRFPFHGGAAMVCFRRLCEMLEGAEDSE